MTLLLYIFVYVPVGLIGTALTFPLAFVLPAFARNRPGPANNGQQYEVGPWLPAWLNWFQTPDNNLYGDAGFQSRHKKNYWAEIQWLWRNPFYGYELRYFNATAGVSYSGNTAITEGDANHPGVEGHLLVKSQDQHLFQYVAIVRIFKTKKCFYFNSGWNIRQVLNPAWVNDPWHPHDMTRVEATFVFSPRIVDFRP